MTIQELSPAELERLVAFKGYGNLNADYWFVGWEEHVARDRDPIEELRVRATWPDIADLGEANTSLGTHFNHYVPTWAVMIKFLLRLKGVPDWADGRVVRDYQVDRLGRHRGESFLAEVLPLPSPSTADWPYTGLFVNRDDYQRQVRPKRLDLLRRTALDASPKFAICYGKGNWNHHMELFPGAYEPVLDGECLASTIGTTTVVLTPFFSPQYLSTKKIDRLCRQLLEFRGDS